MASSRLEKIGTIYTRVTGLLRSGALKEDDIPIWYAVYKAFPPQYEPKYDRPAPVIPIKNIFYLEDEIRARFHKQSKFTGTVNMSDSSSPTPTQHFISLYNRLQEEGNVSEENLFDSALDLFNAEGLAMKERQNLASSEGVTDSLNKSKTFTSMASSFKDAQKERGDRLDINVKDIFKD